MSTKKKILYAAAERFARDGYHRTTVRDICKHAEVNIAAVNYHFSSKAELYRQVYEFIFDETEDHPGGENIDIASVEEWKSCLYSIVSTFLLNISSQKPIYRWKIILFAREMMEPTDNFYLLTETLIKPRLDVLKTYFKYGFPIETTDKDVYLEVFSILSQILFYAQNRKLVISMLGDDFYSEDNLRKIALDMVDGFCAKIKNKYDI